MKLSYFKSQKSSIIDFVLNFTIIFILIYKIKDLITISSSIFKKFMIKNALYKSDKLRLIRFKISIQLESTAPYLIIYNNKICYLIYKKKNSKYMLLSRKKIYYINDIYILFFFFS